MQGRQNWIWDGEKDGKIHLVKWSYLCISLAMLNEDLDTGFWFAIYDFSGFVFDRNGFLFSDALRLFHASPLCDAPISQSCVTFSHRSRSPRTPSWLHTNKDQLAVKLLEVADRRMPSSVIANPTDWCSVTSFLYHGSSIVKYAVTVCWNARVESKLKKKMLVMALKLALEQSTKLADWVVCRRWAACLHHAAGMLELLESNQDTGSGTWARQ